MNSATQCKWMFLLLNFILFNRVEAQTDLIIPTNFQGLSRNFIVHIPPGYDPTKPIPLLLAFHGGGSGGATDFKDRTKIHLIGDTANFITIYPQSLITGEWADTRMNKADIAGIDDVGFTSHIIDTVKTLYNIDITRIYAAGLSTGGFFCQRLALASPLQFKHQIAAFASVSASLTTSLTPYFPPARKIPILYMNGTADPRQPYTGGLHLQNGVGDYINTDTAVAKWASYNNCYTPPTVFIFPDKDPLSLTPSTVEKTVHNPCQNCSEVILYKVILGGHTWPNVTNPTILGPVNYDINASQEIWMFFRRHRLHCSARDAGDQLIYLLNNLGLSSALKNPLQVKIQNGVKDCEDGKEQAAIGKIIAFINEVNAKRKKSITDAQADQLIAFAQSLIDSINNGTAGC